MQKNVIVLQITCFLQTDVLISHLLFINLKTIIMKKIYTIVLMALISFSLSAQLFTEDFEDGIAAIRWNVSEVGTSNTVNFAFDYIGAGLTAAPNGGGLGLKIIVNETEGVASQVYAFPKDQVFTGNFTVSFDCWMNWTGTDGTTEFAIFGVQKTDEIVPSYNGLDLAITGDGGSGSDVRLYLDGSGVDIDPLDTAAIYLAGTKNFVYPPYTNVGDVAGNQWLEVDIEVTVDSVFFYVNDDLWVRHPKTASDGNIFLGYADFFSSLAAELNNWIIYDNLVVTQTSTGLSNAQNAVSSKMYPNPAQDYLTIEVNNASKLELVNTVGQIVHKSTVEGKSTISLRNLKSGMYIGKITSGNGEVEMHKILVK